MTTLTIQIPDKDKRLFEPLAKRFNAKIVKVDDSDHVPNSITKKAVADARAGKTTKISDLDSFFTSL